MLPPAFLAVPAAFAAILIGFVPLPATPSARLPGSEFSPLVRSLRGGGGLPSVRFESNVGQCDAEVDFVGRVAGETLLIARSTVTIVPSGSGAGGHPGERGAVSMRFARSSAAAKSRGIGELGATNYLLGNDPARWRTGISNCSAVRLDAIYPGVDAVLYGHARDVEIDFVIAPGADPAAIEFQYSGVDCVAIDGTGDLVLTTSNGTFRQQRPLAYQRIGDSVRHVGARYVISEDGSAGFSVGAYDPAVPLVIDPVLAVATYAGGSGTDLYNDVAIGRDGSIYVAGYGTSSNFPTASPLQPAAGGGQDLFVAKLDPSGTSLVYATYVGGSADDQCGGIDVDDAGNLYVSGSSHSPNFPTAHPLQPSLAGGSDLVVFKLNPAGTALEYSTYFGGGGNDYANDIKVDADGNAYLSGGLRVFAYEGDAVLLKVNPDGSAIVYGILVRSSSSDVGSGVAVDAANSAYLSGYFQAQGVGYQGFLVKVNPQGSAVAYAAIYGGGLDDFAHDVAVDASGAAHVVGSTKSFDYPTSARGLERSGPVPVSVPTALRALDGTVAAQFRDLKCLDLDAVPHAGATMAPFAREVPPEAGSHFDFFVTKFTPAGTGIAYSRVFAGSANDGANGVVIAADGSAYVTAFTSSGDLTTTNPIQAMNGGDQDCFLVKLDPVSGATTFATYLGGSARDGFLALALDEAGNLALVGSTISTNFPTFAAIQAMGGGAQDGFLVRLEEANFAVAAQSVTARRKESGVITVALNRAPGFDGAVTVTAPDTKPIKVKLTPNTATTTGGSVSFNFKVKKKTPLGAHHLEFTAHDESGTTRMAAMTMTVQ